MIMLFFLSDSMTTKTFICELVSGTCFWLGPQWLNKWFDLALTICGLYFFVSSQFVSFASSRGRHINKLRLNYICVLKTTECREIFGKLL